MNYSTIPKSKFFNTGYLSKNTIDDMRLNQNLMTQRISNYTDHLYTICQCNPCVCQRNSDSLLINSATLLRYSQAVPVQVPLNDVSLNKCARVCNEAPHCASFTYNNEQTCVLQGPIVPSDSVFVQ